MNPNSAPFILWNGFTGVAASSFAVITTFQEQLEWWVRITGGILGLIIAIITLVRFFTRPNPEL